MVEEMLSVVGIDNYFAGEELELFCVMLLYAKVNWYLQLNVGGSQFGFGSVCRYYSQLPFGIEYLLQYSILGKGVPDTVGNII